MKRHLGLIGVLGALALVGCNGSNDSDDSSTALDEQQATLVAALAANEDGSDEAWTSAAGSEPFLVESCGFGAIVSRVLERFDTDGSGDLSEEERSTLVDEFGDPAERFALLVSLYDADGSGALEASELDAVKADLETRERFAARHAARVERFDRNGDGRLGPLERRSVGGVIRDRLADRREAIVDEFDADQNGELDAEEREALAEHLRACVRGESPLLPEMPAEPAPDEGTDSN
jgi:Ca2+-binding EF-hand superfamily protein